MEDEVTHFVTKVCSRVKRTKTHIVPVAPMKPFSSAAPLELLGLPPSCQTSFILTPLAVATSIFLVLTDHFSKFLQVYRTTNKSAKTATDQLCNDLMLRYDLIGKILHNQGRKFENRLLSQLNSPKYYESNDSEPPLTTHRPMAKPSEWTKQY